jgi:collagen type III alpha
VLITGNRLKAEIALHALRAHQLDADWPRVEAVTRSPTDTPGSLASSIGTASSPERVSEPEPMATNRGCHRPLPAKPTRIRFNPPPGWPTPGPGAEPQPGWIAPDDWPVAPDGWSFWIADD